MSFELGVSDVLKKVGVVVSDSETVTTAKSEEMRQTSGWVYGPEDTTRGW